MSFKKVKEYFDGIGLDQRIVEREQIGATVEQASESIGCKPEHIAKTMAFFLDEKAVLIVIAGDAKIDNKKYKSYFHQKVKMIPGEQVETYIGHVPGAVCPFVVNEGFIYLWIYPSNDLISYIRLEVA
ncbi:YbaK/EbsC family protein [Clostridium sp. LBM24168]